MGRQRGTATWAMKMKIQNRSAKQRVDEGLKKKMRRKKEERREAGERGKERKRKYFFNERNLIIKYIYIYIFIYLALNYSVQPYIAMHSSNKGKNFTFSSTVASLFFICSGAKNSFLSPLLQVILLYHEPLFFMFSLIVAYARLQIILLQAPTLAFTISTICHPSLFEPLCINSLIFQRTQQWWQQQRINKH